MRRPRADPFCPGEGACDEGAKMTTATSPERVQLAEFAFNRLSEAELIGHIVSESRSGEGGWVAPVNVDVCRKARKDPAARALVAGATLVVPDGMPLIWAARLRGSPLAERVTGSSLIYSLSEAAARHDRTIYLLGGAPGVPEAAAGALARRYPGLKVAGAYSPPFGFDSSPAGIAEVRERLSRAMPDIVYVGLGFPKQERLTAQLATALPHAWFICCGAAIPFAAGTLTRAPSWMQRTGLEWTHRLLSEPRRLFRRYLLEDLPYAFGLLLTSAAARITRR